MIAYLLVCTISAMAADRYWIGGTNNDNWTETSNWSATDGGATGASIPTSSDDVFFNGNGNNLCVIRGNSTCNNLTVASSFTNTIVQGDKRLEVTGNMSIAGGTYRTSLAPSFSGRLDVDGSFTITGGTLNLRGFDYFRGDFNLNGGTTTTATNGRVYFAGTSSQSINATSDISIANLSVENSAGIVLGRSMTITGTLFMVSGNIDLGGNTMTIGSSAVSPGTLSYSGGRVIGTGILTRYFDGTAYTGTSNDEIRFPFGSGTNDNSLWLGATSAFTGGSVSASFSAIYANSTAMTSYTDNSVTVDRRNNTSWSLSSVNISSASSIFQVTVRTTGITGITDISGIRISEAAGTAQGTHASASGSDVTRSSLSDANLANSYFVAGNSATNQLPVAYEYQNASLQGPNAALIEWATATESNNAGFEIQQSYDGVTFNTIGFVEGHGHSVDPISYSYMVDNLPSGLDVAFFRLVQKDFNGALNYSTIMNVQLDHGDRKMAWFPNPAKSVLSISQGSADRAQIFDLSGRSILDVNIHQQTRIDLTDVDAGSYIIRFLDNGGNVISQDRLIKQ